MQTYQETIINDGKSTTFRDILLETKLDEGAKSKQTSLQNAADFHIWIAQKGIARCQVKYGTK